MTRAGERLIKAAKEARAIARNPDLDPIQNNCKYGYVLPDRCRYVGRLGCDCGAYPPLREPVR